MDDTPRQNDKNEVLKADIITTKNENRPVWMKVLFLCGNKILYLFLNIITYFTNRGIFAIKVFCSFNLILIGFIIVEWWLYQYIAYELTPKLFQEFKLNYINNQPIGE